ncbi:MAG: hypothetical protein QM681_07250 [Novosphingobium sp.]
MITVRNGDDLGAVWTDDLGAQTYTRIPNQNPIRESVRLKSMGNWLEHEKRTEIIGEVVGFNRQFLPKLPTCLPIGMKPVV